MTFNVAYSRIITDDFCRTGAPRGQPTSSRPVRASWWPPQSSATLYPITNYSLTCDNIAGSRPDALVADATVHAHPCESSSTQPHTLPSETWLQDLTQQVHRHQWPGLTAWRSKGRDLRLTWGPPGVDVPLALPLAQAPSLLSALPPGSPHPSCLMEAGVMVLQTACPAAKAAITHAAWGAYLEGRLPLREGDGRGGRGREGGGEGDGEREGGERKREGEEGGERGKEEGGRCGFGGSVGWPERLPERPARPERPRLVRPKEIPGHANSPLGLSGYMLHNLAHIELNAIDLAWDTVVRFSHLDLPDAFYEDFARVADDESRHLGWCLQRLEELGHRYGDMDAHDLLWQGCADSAGDLGARLAVVPMSQEARGLDAGSRLAVKLTGAGDVRSAAVVALIAVEERAHVAVGVCWFAAMCGALGMDPGAHYRRWLLHLNPDLLKGPFNHRERQVVGLQRDWYDPTAWPEVAREDAAITTTTTTISTGNSRILAPTSTTNPTPGPDANPSSTHAPHTNTASSLAATEGEANAALKAPPLAAAPSAGRASEEIVSAACGSPGVGIAGEPAKGSVVTRVVKPVRGVRATRLEGPQPVLSGEQLAVLVERLSLFAEVEGAAAGRGMLGVRNEVGRGSRGVEGN